MQYLKKRNDEAENDIQNKIKTQASEPFSFEILAMFILYTQTNYFNSSTLKN